jgi:hypothetical protein
MIGTMRMEEDMNEIEELREQLNELTQRFTDYVEATAATADIESILASNGELDGEEATADSQWRSRQGGKPAHLRHNSGMPGRPKLTDSERIRRAYNYATTHDAEVIPALRNRIEALESAVGTIAKAVNQLTVGMGKRGGVLGWLTGE